MKKSNWINKGSDLSLHVPSGVIYVRKKFLRQKIPMLFKSTGEKLQHKAKTEAYRLIQLHLEKHLKKAKTFGEVADEFLRTENPNIKKRRVSSQNNNTLIITELKRELGDRLLSEVADESFWVDWFDGFIRRKTRRNTFNDYVVRMNMLMRFAQRRKYINWLTKFDFVDEVKESGRVLSRAELTALYNAMSENGRDQFTLAYECGMRLREMLYLTWDRIDFERRTITLRKEDVKTGRKSGKGREFMPTPYALERLANRRAKTGEGSPFVFPSKTNQKKPQRNNRRMWERAKSKAKIFGRCRWHDIRHTAVSHMLLEKQMPIALVSEYVGTSVRTLQRVYLHSTAEQTRMVANALSIKG